MSVAGTSLADRAEYAALRGAMGALGALRWNRARRFGAALGGLGYRPFAVRRWVVEKQIAAAFPELDERAVAELARASYRHLGQVTAEAALLPRLGRAHIPELFVEPEGWEVVEAAAAEERGIFFVSGHLGNWELGGAYLVSRGLELDVVARRMSNAMFDSYLNGTRTALGMSVVYDRDAVRRAARGVKEQRSMAFLVDQGALNLASTVVPFFGMPAKTPRGPAVLSLRWKVPVVFTVAIRQPDGRYRMFFEKIEVIDTGDREADVDRLVASYTLTLERWVRRFPEQYFWHHRRWKHQPADTPPDLRDPTAAGRGGRR